VGILKVAVGILSFNRPHLLKQTLESIRESGYTYDELLVDGGSRDDTKELVLTEGGECHDLPTVGESMNYIIETCIERWQPDIVVFSADDYRYEEDWLKRLVNFWNEAPDNIKLISLNWEPLYLWNAVKEQIYVGGEHVLIRNSIPGSSWSFRAEDWPLIGPVPKSTGGEDFHVNGKMHEKGYRLAALNLTDHIGEKESAWGNESWKNAEPLELT